MDPSVLNADEGIDKTRHEQDSTCNTPSRRDCRRYRELARRNGHYRRSTCQHAVQRNRGIFSIVTTARRHLPFKKLESSRAPLVEMVSVEVTVAVSSAEVVSNVVLVAVVDSDSSFPAPDVEATAVSASLFPVGSGSDPESFDVVGLGESSPSWRRPKRASCATASWKARSRHSKA